MVILYGRCAKCERTLPKHRRTPVYVTIAGGKMHLIPDPNRRRNWACTDCWPCSRGEAGQDAPRTEGQRAGMRKVSTGQ